MLGGFLTWRRSPLDRPTRSDRCRRRQRRALGPLTLAIVVHGRVSLARTEIALVLAQQIVADVAQVILGLLDVQLHLCRQRVQRIEA